MSGHEAELRQPDDGTSRRTFLAGAAGVAGALAAASSLTPPPAQAQDAGSTTATRTFARGTQTLELDGVGVGVLQSAAGGDAVGEVVHEPALTYYAKKHLAGLRYEDIVLQADLSMGQAVYDWVAATWSGQFPRKDGAVVFHEHDGTTRSRRAFAQALLTETAFPTLDASSSRDPAFLSLRLVPESTATTKGPSGGSRSQAAKGKKWLASNFRLEIDGLDCTRVNKVDAFTIKQTAVQDDVGESRDDTRVPTLAFPDLVVTLSASTAKTWQRWFDDFVIGGQNGDQFERSGTLQLLAPDLKEVLATVGFSGLGIYRLVDEPADSDAVGRVRAHMYCEQMSFALGTSA